MSVAAVTRSISALPARPQLSLIFPVFDEEQNLGELLDAALRIAPRLAADFEVLVVDDGSRDRSGAIIDAWSRTHPSVRRLSHAANRGYGAALRTGLREARGELVFFSDADLQFDLSELEKLLEHADDSTSSLATDIRGGTRGRASSSRALGVCSSASSSGCEFATSTARSKCSGARYSKTSRSSHSVPSSTPKSSCEPAPRATGSTRCRCRTVAGSTAARPALIPASSYAHSQSSARSIASCAPRASPALGG